MNYFFLNTPRRQAGGGWVFKNMGIMEVVYWDILAPLQ